MDYAYRHRSIMPHVAAATEFGQAIYDTTSSAAQSQSARDRVSLVASTIARLANGRKLRVGSFASGHARELEYVEDASNSIAEFVIIDTDEQSIEEIRRSYGKIIKLTPFKRNVLRVRSEQISKLDFAYSMGLFDYLNESAAKRIVRIMSDTVAKGGTLLFGNLTEKAANLGYCEAVMDWWMIPRTYDEMVDLGEMLERSGEWSVKVSQKGCFYYLLGAREA